MKAFLSCREEKRPSLIEHEAVLRRQPAALHDSGHTSPGSRPLPKTSTDKIDYQRLKELALMDFALTEEQRLLRDGIVRFAAAS